MSALRVCALLVRLYPAAYRRARGAELLGTLLESVGDRRWPPLREVGALVRGALRAHAGRDRCADVTASWMAAFRAAALMLLVLEVADALRSFHLHLTLPSIGIGTSPFGLPAAALGLCAVVAVARGRYLGGVLLTSGTLLLAVPANMPDVVFSFGRGLPLVVALLLPLLKHRPPPVSGLLRYAPVVVPAAMLGVDLGLAAVMPDISGILEFGVTVGLWVAGLLWLAIDERVAMALGLLLSKTALVSGILVAAYGPAPNVAMEALLLAVVAVPPATLLLTSAAAAREQALP